MLGGDRILGSDTDDSDDDIVPDLDIGTGHKDTCVFASEIASTKVEKTSSPPTPPIVIVVKDESDSSVSHSVRVSPKAPISKFLLSLESHYKFVQDDFKSVLISCDRNSFTNKVVDLTSFKKGTKLDGVLGALQDKDKFIFTLKHQPVAHHENGVHHKAETTVVKSSKTTIVKEKSSKITNSKVESTETKKIKETTSEVTNGKVESLKTNNVIKKSSVSTIGIKEKSPDVTKIREKTPELTKIKEKSPDVTKIKEKPSEITNGKVDSSFITNVKEKTPEITKIKEKTPEINNTKEKTPDVTNIKEKTPDVNNIKEKTPEINKIKEKTPEVTNIKDNSSDVTNTTEEPSEIVNGKLELSVIPNIKVESPEKSKIKEKPSETANIEVKSSESVNIKEKTPELTKDESSEPTKDKVEPSEKIIVTEVPSETTNSKLESIEITNFKEKSPEITKEIPTEPSKIELELTESTSINEKSLEVTKEAPSETINSKIESTEITNIKEKSPEVTKETPSEPTKIEGESNETASKKVEATETTNDKVEAIETTNDKVESTEITNSKVESTETTNNKVESPRVTIEKEEEAGTSSAIDEDPIKFVGLVNQAMTCYLNSLIQALFMTPEFRNALYRWKFQGKEEETSLSITYQLQKLFLSLQTSTRAAVETTGLTKSFGWDSSEAWQQHDIQELCRVMFDALEQQFKQDQSGCDQPDLINNLYQGKMMDYVKCLECGTEKSREDTFLDIPLPIRPYGSCVGYGDITEALRAFVQPETLDGNNQYHCEKCNKKCDAHKGLKFTQFPYLLTLHLMRFSFDYDTMRRIKLNDKVVFPNVLNLNSFNAAEGGVVFEKDKEEESEGFPEEMPTKCDDSSTTDSGSALDDESCQDQDQDVDEGIDISNPDNKENDAKGPYLYELFSIMIHSGSASGGHYYAYIKDFDTNLWYCFNDQSVSRLTDEDICKTYGGSGPGYYSGVYSSSTNAYMLMYRQIDRERNVNAITKEELPQHIRELHIKLQEKEESDKAKQHLDGSFISIVIHVKPPNGDPVSGKIIVQSTDTLKYVTEFAYSHLNMKDIVTVPLKQCRLIKINHSNCFEAIENRDYDSIGDILNHKIKSNSRSIQYEMLLEYKQDNESFKIYVPGSVKLNMYLIDVDTDNVQGPILLQTNLKCTVVELKNDIIKQYNKSNDISSVYIALEKFRNVFDLKSDSNRLEHEGFEHDSKIYVSFDKMDPDPGVELFKESAMYNIIERITNTIRLTVQLPDIDQDALNKYKITQTKKYINTNNEQDQGSGDEILTPPSMLPLVLSNENIHTSDQSTSEDSSLTDSERTLMGDDPEDGREDIIGSTIQDLDLDAPANQVRGKEVPSICLSTASSLESSSRRIHDDDDDYASGDMTDVERELQFVQYKYFKVLDANFNPNITIDRPQLMIEIDQRTKVAYLMKQLEPYVRVPITNFCICTCDQQETELKPKTKMTNNKDGEVITVKLKRILQDGEYLIKIFKLLDDKEPAFLLELIMSKGQAVGDLKKEVVEELNKKSSSDLQVERCRLREKSWKIPGKILLDNQIFGKEIIMMNSTEFFVQEIDRPEIKTDENQTVLNVRHYHLDTGVIDKSEEIVIEEISLATIKAEISKLSEIPAEFIDVTQVRETTYDRVEDKVLNLSRQSWNQEPPEFLQDGKLYVYCDNRVEKKIITKEDISNSDKNSSSNTAKYLSRNKEKALKIVNQREIITPVIPSLPD